MNPIQNETGYLPKHQSPQIDFLAERNPNNLLLADRGALFTFGDGRHGKLGLGDENFANQFKPSRVNRFSKFNVQSVSDRKGDKDAPSIRHRSFAPTLSDALSGAVTVLAIKLQRFVQPETFDEEIHLRTTSKRVHLCDFGKENS